MLQNKLKWAQSQKNVIRSLKTYVFKSNRKHSMPTSEYQEYSGKSQRYSANT